MSRLPSKPSESQLIKVWQYQLLDRKGLVTEKGEPIEIIYPGRINDDQGADFRDAVIATSKGLIKGDIEVHVKSSGWWDHQHHRDEVYNRVILHVVMWHNTENATILQNGGEVPVLALHKYIKIPLEKLPGLVCSTTTPNRPCFRVAQRLSTDTMTELLDRAGEERFFTKVARFQADLTQMAACQTLYQGVMGALGYSKNKLPFMELARRLPLQILESTAKGEISDEECLARQQALLLGTAGLLPFLCQDRRSGKGLNGIWLDRLERLWSSYHITEVMSLDAWHLFKVRPSNSPILRLVAMSYLVLRYRERGLLEELVNIVKEVPIGQGYRRMEKRLMVTTDDCWPYHFLFSRIGSPALLGSGRAADIIINVLLPFTFVWSQYHYQPELGRKAFDLYHCFPKLAVNSVERHMMEQLGLSNGLVNSAQRQQGLLHIYNNLCIEGRCSDCLLSQFEVGNHV